MAYSVYSLNFSSLFPQQSEYLLMTTSYFLLSICWTLISMVWFMIYNYITTKADISKLLCVFCARLQKVLFCCFPSPSKPDTKADENKKIIVRNDAKTLRHQKIQEATSSQRIASVCCQKPFASCCQMRNRVEGTNNEQCCLAEDSQSFWANLTNTEANRNNNMCNYEPNQRESQTKMQTLQGEGEGGKHRYQTFTSYTHTQTHW